MTKTRYKMPTIGVFTILLILVEISPIKCLKLSQGDVKVKFVQSSDNYYVLTMDEELSNVVLFKIEEADGDVRMDFFPSCSDVKYGTTLSNTELKLTKPLDYEKKDCIQTKHTVKDAGGGAVLVELNLNNIDDNPPQFKIGPHCQLKENTKYPKESANCSLIMTDLDGMMEKAVLTIQDNENAGVFLVSFKEVPKTDDKTATVVIYLKDEITLDYETKTSYVFVLLAKEELTSGEVQVVIDVLDQPDTPPQFTKLFTTKMFEENINQKFYVSARDGDIQINSTIIYEITKDGCADKKYSCSITISEYGGEIDVCHVDREETGDTIPLTIQAKELDDGSTTPLEITFFILDQDDNEPTIKMEKSETSIDEGSRGTISSLKFSVEDMDLSDNGTFSIRLENGIDTVDHQKAFEVIPDSGYQNSSFIITITNSTALDYEDKDWKVIKLKIVAVEKADHSHTNIRDVTINLNDINDEAPIFVNTSDSVNIFENIKAGEFVFNATAVDRDEGDIVTYDIVGVWKKSLAINEQGIITTINDNTFDYELLQQVIISITASDKDFVHTTTKTLTINVQDVDDEPPVMRIDINTGDYMVKIPENSPFGTPVPGVTISVTDPDTKPKLKLEIDWDKSYVTKNSGIKKLDESVWQCFEVDSKAEETQTIERTISINDKCSPDFEVFDAIVIYLKATDENTVSGKDSTTGSTLVNIVDVNDNYPYFIISSLKDLTVTDGTNTATKIGIIAAKDDDIGDKLWFSIKPAENQPDWIDIDKNSGQLTVKSKVVIDCDSPERDDISYEITVHDPDPKHNNTTKVTITIIDINDNVPHIKNKKTEVEILEKSDDDTKVADLGSEDADRDVPFKTVVFKFETNLTNEASNRFDISEDGHVTVKLRNGASLNRDIGPGNYILPILAYDNPNGTLQLKDSFDLTVKLLDVDDNIPKLDIESLICTENLKKGDILKDIEAIDPDEDGPNSDVSFQLNDVIPVGDHSKQLLDESFFEITKTGAKTATIKILKSMKNFWGKYNITIRTKDAGMPNLYNDNHITITVERFNFEQPVFEFPATDADKAIVVNKDRTKANSDMILYDGGKLRSLNVNDKQDHKWDVTFEIAEEDGGPADLFRIIPYNSNWEGNLQLQRSPSDDELSKDHKIKINAKVKNDMKEGEAQVSVETTMTVKFFSSSEQPQFAKSTSNVSMHEANIFEKANLPQKASFKVDNVNMKPFYFLAKASDTFKVDPDNGTIMLSQQLDYGVKNKHTIKIVALNERIPPIEPPADGAHNVLELAVFVTPMNIHEPVFTSKKFSGAFLRTYSKGTTILTITATDADQGLQDMTFSLNNKKCSESLKAPENPFEIGEKDGKITNSFTVTSDMAGYCDLIVQVQDEKDDNGTIHTVSTSVQINVISDDKLVKFTFLNMDSVINENQDIITSILNDTFKDYNYRSFLADFSYDDNFKNTTSHFYFMNADDQPVPAEEILGNLTEPNKYATLAKQLSTIHVQLYYFSYDNLPEAVDDYLRIWLIVTIFVLASLLTMMTIVFFFRNKALTRRINNLSTTKFGSQESGLNRAGVTAPTTNKNAVEGSNPVFNSDSFIKEIEDDRNSVLSGDSDLLGVENNPDFDDI